MSSSVIIPAGKPPPGVTSNFVNPRYDGGRFIAINSTFLAFAFVVVLLRVYTRIVIQRCFAADDYVMVLAMVLSVILSALTLDLLNYGLGKHIWDVPLTSLSPGFLKVNVIAAIVYCAATAASKSSILLFYLRIFPGRVFRISVWLAAFFVVGYNLGTIFANIFSCSPIAKSWDVTIEGGKCINRPVLYFANAGLGIFTDFVTLLLPIPLIRKLQLPLKQKIGIVAVLMTGGFVCIISIVRLASLYTLLQSTDLTYATSNALLWCMIELNVSIVGGSVAVVRPFVRQHFPALLGATSNGRYGSGDRKYQRSNSFGLRSREREQIHNKDDSRHVRQMGGNTPTVYTATVKGGATTRMSVSNGAGDGGSEEFIMYNGGGVPESKIVRTLEYTIEEGQTPQSVREC